MCTYSMIADHGLEKLKEYYPGTAPLITWPNEDARIAELERKVADLEELLRKAKVYDEETGQKDCELDEKKEALRKLADQLGVEIVLP